MTLTATKYACLYLPIYAFQKLPLYPLISLLTRKVHIMYQTIGYKL